jgi:hypothetical protein
MMEDWSCERHIATKGIDGRVSVGDVALVHDENLPRGFVEVKEDRETCAWS